MTSDPAGIVTFLFTDIVGSTRLWDTQHEAMKAAHGRQADLIDGAVAAHNGQVIKSRGEGDSTFSVFAAASDAIAAVCELQRALIAEEWPTDIPIRVRAALHCGPAEAQAGEYNSTTVTRCARLRGLASSGQTLVSRIVFELSQDRLPANVTLRSLGSHALKDLQRPEEVFQLSHPDLPDDFPALRSLAALPTNLPQQLTHFIGREAELRQLAQLLRTRETAGSEQSTRLLTLTGSGGAGKTRLAVQTGAELLESYPDGVWLVELAEITDASLLPQAVATVLGLREEPGRTLRDTLRDYLRERTVLLMLDNCEHLVTACATLAETLLRTCSKLRILATSREPLNIAGETVWRIPSLSLPVESATISPETVQASEAVRLFVDRVRAVVPNFAVTAHNAPAIARITRRLDGIPLALELAAARVRALTVEQIDTRLSDRFRLLTGGNRTSLPRQQTLRALIDWSYDLLSLQEKALLARLSVFSGGWTLEAAENVGSSTPCPLPETATNASWPASVVESHIEVELEDWEILDVLSALVDKSLVLVDDNQGSLRYRMLESIREYGRWRLQESGEEAAFQYRHQLSMGRMAQEASPALNTSQQAEWLDRLEVEHGNIRAALDFCLESEGGAEAAGRFCADLQQFWWLHGQHLSEGRDYFQAALTRPDWQIPSKTRGQVLNGAGVIAWKQGDLGNARDYYEQSLAIRRGLNDTYGVAAALNNLGNLLRTQGEYARAQELYEECLSIDRASGDKLNVAIGLLSLGNVAAVQDDMETARAAYEECLAIEEEIQDQKTLAMCLLNLSVVESSARNYSAAAAYCERSLGLQRTLGHQEGMLMTLGHLGSILAKKGEYAAARRAFAECLPLCLTLSNKYVLLVALEAYGVAAPLIGDPDFAVRCLAAVTALRESLGIPIEPSNRSDTEQACAALRTSLGMPLFEVLWNEGALLTLDAALNLALQETAPPQT